LITKISGKLLAVAEEVATLEVGQFEYEVLIPEFSRRQLQPRVGQEVSLFTIHYFDGNPAQGRVTPRLVGFLSEVEREFFELFCSVDGIGAKKALRAMVRPVRDVAVMIEEQDSKGLSTLPGVGPATADRVIAKLRRKMPKFVLMVSREAAGDEEVAPDVVQETFAVLCSLGHSESDARKLLDGALAGKAKYKDVESLLHAVYQHAAKK
jgi:Holliday junction DNA helicase RuvA